MQVSLYVLHVWDCVSYLGAGRGKVYECILKTFKTVHLAGVLAADEREEGGKKLNLRQLAKNAYIC